MAVFPVATTTSELEQRVRHYGTRLLSRQAFEALKAIYHEDWRGFELESGALALRLTHPNLIVMASSPFEFMAQVQTVDEVFDPAAIQAVWKLATIGEEIVFRPAPLTTLPETIDNPAVEPRYETPQLRETEVEWLAQNRDEVSKYAGKWIAIEGTGIVAVANSEMDADRIARDKGVNIPFVVRIPQDDEPPLIAICQRVHFP